MSYTNNKGIINELEILYELNNHTFNQLSEHWKINIKKMFNNVSNDSFIHCFKPDNSSKADLIVIIGETSKGISIKSGFICNFHTEKLYNFITYLKREGVKDKFINTLKLYHYGDGTTDGTGKKRFYVDEIKKQMPDEIKEFNEYVDKKINKKKLFKRLMAEGTSNQEINADYLYFGNKGNGLLIPIDELIEDLATRPYEDFNSIHFGPFTYMPDERRIDMRYSHFRDFARFRWNSLSYTLYPYLEKHPNEFSGEMYDEIIKYINEHKK